MAKFRFKRLTLRQREVFDFIENYIAEAGYPPTIREIGKALGFSEKAAFDYVNALVRKGMLERRADDTPRNIKLTAIFATVFMESTGGYTASRCSKRRSLDSESCCVSYCRRSCADDARAYHRISRRAADSRQGCRAIASIGCGGNRQAMRSDASKSVCTGNPIFIFRKQKLIGVDDRGRIRDSQSSSSLLSAPTQHRHHQTHWRDLHPTPLAEKA